MRLIYLIFSLFMWLPSQVFALFMHLRGRYIRRGMCVMPVPVISVGNLIIGGGGKTPMTCYLASFLLPKFPENTVWCIAHGYKRASKGIVIASPEHDARQLGDETYLIAQRFPALRVLLCTRFMFFYDKMHSAAHYVMKQKPTPRVFLLDDGLQSFTLQHSCSIVLSAYDSPFFEDKVFPAGFLRESPRALKRASAFVYTKCPAHCTEKKKQAMQEAVWRYTSQKIPIFFSHIVYHEPRPFGHTQTPRKNILLITGVAHYVPLLTYLSKKHHIYRHWARLDHCHYEAHQLISLISEVDSENLSIFTTEKDYVKIKACIQDVPALCALPWFYLPIEVSFGDQESAFQRYILEQAGLAD